MKTQIHRKGNFPLHKIRHYLEPGPVVLVTSAWKGERDVMTMGWHTVMEFSPSLVGCVIASDNHTFGLVRKSRECVINLPTADMIDTVVGIGNCSGGKDGVDKFARFSLTAEKSGKVAAPSLRECVANFECRLADARLVNRFNFFVFEVVRARVAASMPYPKTLHYHGAGIFTADDGKPVDKGRKFAKWRGTPTF